MPGREAEQNASLFPFADYSVFLHRRTAEENEEPEVCNAGPVTAKTFRVITAILAGALAILLAVTLLSGLGTPKVSRSSGETTIHLQQTAPLTAVIKDINETSTGN